MKRILKYWMMLQSWQRRRKNSRPSTLMNSALSKLSRQTSQPDTQSSSTFHRSTETLIYNDFLLILTGAEPLTHLIIEGNPPEEELILAWANIQEQYSDTIRTEKATSLISISKRMLLNQWQITTVDQCILVLRLEVHQESIDTLFNLGYPLIEYNGNWHDYIKQVEMVEMEAKFLIVLKNQLYNEYKRLAGDEAPGDSNVTMKDYDKELAVISKYMAFDVDKMKITTAKFCSYLNIYLDHIEETKKAADNGRAV